MELSDSLRRKLILRMSIQYLPYMYCTFMIFSKFNFTCFDVFALAAVRANVNVRTSNGSRQEHIRVLFSFHIQYFIISCHVSHLYPVSHFMSCISFHVLYSQFISCISFHVLYLISCPVSHLVKVLPPISCLVFHSCQVSHFIFCISYLFHVHVHVRVSFYFVSFISCTVFMSCALLHIMSVYFMYYIPFISCTIFRFM